MLKVNFIVQIFGSYILLHYICAIIITQNIIDHENHDQQKPDNDNRLGNLQKQ